MYVTDLEWNLILLKLSTLVLIRQILQVVSKKGIKVQRKQDRKNHLTQARNLARQEVTARKRGIGGHGAPPVLVALIPLSDSQVPNVPGFLEKLTSSMQDAEVG